MSRLLRTTLPTVRENLTPSIIDQKKFKEDDESYKQKYTNDYDRRHKVVSLPYLNPGDRVYVKDQGCYGEVVDKLSEPRSYKVSMGGGNIVRRNRRSLIHTGIDNETLSPTKPTTPRKSLAESRVKILPESPITMSSSPPRSDVRDIPAEPAVGLPGTSDGASNISNSRTTRLGRVIRSTRQPDMVYYK